jgi:hypothetical protein
MKSLSVQMGLARGLYGAGEGLRQIAPVAGNSARVPPLVKAKQEKGE